MKKLIAGNLVKFTFEDGIASYTFDCTKMSGANRAHAIPFAMCHRLGDSAAFLRGLPGGEGGTITEAMRREAVAETGAHYESGSENWELRTARAPAQSPTIAAIAAKMGITYAEAEAKVAEQMLGEMS